MSGEVTKNDPTPILLENPSVNSSAQESTEDNVEIPNKLYFRIGEVAEMIGVDTHVLRYWENEMDFQPHRSSSGQRLYRKVDISNFIRVKKLIHDEGYTIAGARKILQEKNASSVPVESLQNIIQNLQTLKTTTQQIRQSIPKGFAI